MLHQSICIIGFVMPKIPNVNTIVTVNSKPAFFQNLNDPFQDSVFTGIIKNTNEFPIPIFIGGLYYIVTIFFLMYWDTYMLPKFQELGILPYRQEDIANLKRLKADTEPFLNIFSAEQYPLKSEIVIGESYYIGKTETTKQYIYVMDEHYSENCLCEISDSFSDHYDMKIIVFKVIVY